MVLVVSRRKWGIESCVWGRFTYTINSIYLWKHCIRHFMFAVCTFVHFCSFLLKKILTASLISLPQFCSVGISVHLKHLSVGLNFWSINYSLAFIEVAQMHFHVSVISRFPIQLLADWDRAGDFILIFGVP